MLRDMLRGTALVQIDAHGQPRVIVMGDAATMRVLELGLQLLMRVDLPGFFQATCVASKVSPDDTERAEVGIGA